MIPKPVSWDRVWYEDIESTLSLRISVYLNADVIATFTQEDLSECIIEAGLFDDLSIGNASSARLKFVLKDAKNLLRAFTKGQKVVFEVRPISTLSSIPYIPQGTFYVDSAELSNNVDVSVTAFDEIFSIARLETGNFTTSYRFGDFITGYLKNACGLKANPYTIVNISIADGTGITTSNTNTVYYIQVGINEPIEVRELLQTGAALAGGNISINKRNIICLDRLDDGPSITTEPIGEVVTASSVYWDEDNQVVSGVDLTKGDETYVAASGWRIPAQINKHSVITASSSIAQAIDNNMRTDSPSIRASNVRVEGAYISPLIELGDTVSVDLGNGEYFNFMVCEYKLSYVGGCWGYLGVPKSSDAIHYSINNEWNSTDGWEAGWSTVNMRSTSKTYAIEILNNYQFRIPVQVDIYGTSHSGQHIARVIGLESFELTISYYSTVDNTLKSVTVTAYLDKDIYPLEFDGTYYGVRNMSFYCSELPDDSIGASINGNPVKLKRPTATASGYQDISFKVSNN